MAVSVMAARKNVDESAKSTSACEDAGAADAASQVAPGYREQVAARFARVIASALEKLDRAFYELAVEEKDAAMQERYLEAKRAVHLKRIALQTALQKHFFFAFDKVLRRGGLDEDPAEITSTEIIHSLLKQGDCTIEQISMDERVEPPVQVQPPAQVQKSRPDPYLVAVHRMERGEWVELREADGQIHRARLVWINPVTGAYIFINQKGLKVAEKSPQGLAGDFKRGMAKVIKDVGLLDIAASNILYGLRKKMSNGTGKR
jgi:hypothetical protein